jgi:hypothetical protein
MMGVRLFVLVGLASCGGSVLMDPEGTCLLGGSEWSCKTALNDASRVLPECPNDIAPGGSCLETTVSTNNPTMPAQYNTITECVSCASSGGSGTDWTCGSAGWQVAGTFSCAP